MKKSTLMAVVLVLFTSQASWSKSDFLKKSELLVDKSAIKTYIADQDRCTMQGSYKILQIKDGSFGSRSVKLEDSQIMCDQQNDELCVADKSQGYLTSYSYLVDFAKYHISHGSFLEVPSSVGIEDVHTISFTFGRCAYDCSSIRVEGMIIDCSDRSKPLYIPIPDKQSSKGHKDMALHYSRGERQEIKEIFSSQGFKNVQADDYFKQDSCFSNYHGICGFEKED